MFTDERRCRRSLPVGYADVNAPLLQGTSINFTFARLNIITPTTHYPLPTTHYPLPIHLNLYE